MTRQPWTIAHDAPLERASQVMREHGIRHLPVTRDVALVGIISERDVYRAHRLQHLSRPLTVEDAMSDDVYTARPDQPLDEVVEAMAQHKYGSAVVMNHDGEIDGIFTTVDGMEVLANILRRAAA